LKEKMKLPKDEEIIVEAAAPTTYGTTAENLESAMNGENYENSKMYPEFADVAEKEQLYHIASRLRAISIAEMHHEERYQKLLNQVKNGSVFKKDKEVEWACAECGYLHKGEEPPEKCPSCDHPKSFYYIKCEEY
jgi:rubrerythrin